MRKQKSQPAKVLNKSTFKRPPRTNKRVKSARSLSPKRRPVEIFNLKDGGIKKRLGIEQTMSIGEHERIVRDLVQKHSYEIETLAKSHKAELQKQQQEFENLYNEQFAMRVQAIQQRVDDAERMQKELQQTRKILSEQKKREQEVIDYYEQILAKQEGSHVKQIEQMQIDLQQYKEQVNGLSRQLDGLFRNVKRQEDIFVKFL